MIVTTPQDVALIDARKGARDVPQGERAGARHRREHELLHLPALRRADRDLQARRRPQDRGAAGHGLPRRDPARSRRSSSAATPACRSPSPSPRGPTAKPSGASPRRWSPRSARQEEMKPQADDRLDADRESPPSPSIADAHLSGPGGPAGPLVEQLRALPGQGCRRLVLMGDLFQAWVGFESFETPDIPPWSPPCGICGAQGIEVDYVEGNRDFFLAGSPYADAFDRVALETAFERRGRPLPRGPRRRAERPRLEVPLLALAVEERAGPLRRRATSPAGSPTGWSTRPSSGSRRPTSSTARRSPRRPSAPTPSAGWPRGTTCSCWAISTSRGSGRWRGARCGCSTPGSGAAAVEWLR